MKLIISDGGRRAAGYFGLGGGDCVVRAVAVAAELPYSLVYDALAEINARMPKTRRRVKTTGIRTASHGIYTSSVLFKRYMEQLGFVWTPTMQIGSGCKVHLRAEELPSGRLVVAVSRHYTAMIDGVIHDNHDPSRGGTRCVYGHWKMT